MIEKSASTLRLSKSCLARKYSKEKVDVNFIHEKLENFNIKNLEDKIDAIITDVPEPWDFFINNKINTNLNWVSYLPSMSQIIRINEALKENNFQDIEVKEVILRDWIVDNKIIRPTNKLVSHTGFLVSAKYIKY